MSFDSFCNSCCESLLLFACISEAYFPLPLNRNVYQSGFLRFVHHLPSRFLFSYAVRELIANDDGEAISRDLHWYYMQNVYTNQIFQRQPLSINFIIFTANKKKYNKTHTYRVGKIYFIFIVYHSIIYLLCSTLLPCLSLPHPPSTQFSRCCGLCIFICAICTYQWRFPKIGNGNLPNNCSSNCLLYAVWVLFVLQRGV